MKFVKGGKRNEGAVLYWCVKCQRPIRHNDAKTFFQGGVLCGYCGGCYSKRHLKTKKNKTRAVRDGE